LIAAGNTRSPLRSDIHMPFRITLALALIGLGFLGCGGDKTVIPNQPFSEDEKKAIEDRDKKIADEESHGAKRR
jgi:hypothetical protein